MENIQKKTPKILGIALVAYLICAAVLAVVGSSYGLLSRIVDRAFDCVGFVDFIEEVFYIIFSKLTLNIIGDLVGDFFNSIWVMLLAVFVMFVYRKNDKSVLLPMALIVGTVTSFIAACTLVWDFFKHGNANFIKHLINQIFVYGLIDKNYFFWLIDYLIWFLEIAIYFVMPLLLIVTAIGAFSRKALILAKIGSVGYLISSVGILLSSLAFSLLLTVWNWDFYTSYIEQFVDFIVDRLIYTLIPIVGLIPAIVLAVLFFKYIKKPQQKQIEAEPVETTEEIAQ